MPTEKEAEALFKKYTKKYIAKLGRHALSNTEIDMIMKQTKKISSPHNYRGCFAQDETFLLKNGLYVINTDLMLNPGIHWIGMYLTAKTAYFYDSFGRKAQALVPHLIKRLKERKIVNSDRKDKEQKNSEIICGHLTMSFLQVVKDLGVRAAIKI
jgi:hypothetical protein